MKPQNILAQVADANANKPYYLTQLISLVNGMAIEQDDRNAIISLAANMDGLGLYLLYQSLKRHQEQQDGHTPS